MQKRQPILELLFPTARANVLRVLFMKPTKRRSVRELARLSRTALSTTQEELAMLLASDLVTASPWVNGCRRFYQVNLGHALFPHLLGIVHWNSRVREIEISALRRVRRPKWKPKSKPQPVYWRPPAHPTGTMYSRSRPATGLTGR